MNAAVGVDLIEVGRVASVLAHHGDRFLARVYTDRERAYCRCRAPELAARFAAKEAVAKSLGTGIGPIEWREIEVVRRSSGPPALELHGRARALAERLGLGRPLLSLAHTHEHAIAFVVWQGGA
ncbi:MAG TPA: holo-ACP synthase [Chloroflexota bacterium]|nr:holo-ACP synthase [Chloroflexota bacterium]